jgi:UDP-glucose 4-epimerase
MSKLQGACCLVTGGAGFIGSTIVDQLLAAGASEVRIIDNFVRGSWANLASALNDMHEQRCTTAIFGTNRL